MRTLTWKLILPNLLEALWELEGVHWRLHYRQFGEMPEEKVYPHQVDPADVAMYAAAEGRRPFSETRLFFCLEHAYQHLNWAWNCRYAPEEWAWQFSERDGNRRNRFPETGCFADLWPEDRSVKDSCDRLPGRKWKGDLAPARIAVQTACLKLRGLCRLVAKELGLAPPRKMRRRVRRNPESGGQPLTEKAFASRLHRIYSEMNTAWNSRRDRTFVLGDRAFLRRRAFPSIFATGCHNMWRPAGGGKGRKHG